MLVFTHILTKCTVQETKSRGGGGGVGDITAVSQQTVVSNEPFRYEMCTKESV
jgi:hypothetical protein